jgi:hypothetical protein
LGNGDGTFGAPTSVATSSDVFDLVVVDFNGDGILDLAVADYGNQTIDIFLGVGDGTFGTPTQITGAADVISLAVGDFNGDGKVDLVGGSESGGISILLGNGDGTFQAPATVNGTANGFFGVSAGDLNGDGNLDIVSSSTSGTTQVSFGVGDGTFQASQLIGSSGESFGLLLGNFATGGGLDIAAMANSGNQIEIFLPTVVISPSAENVGSVAVGGTAQHAFTVTNDTSSTVTISSVSFTGANPGDFVQTNTCSSPLATAATCTVTVTFAPATVGVRAAVLNLNDNAPASPQTAALTGTGFAAPVASLSTTTLSFGSLNIGVTSASMPVTLTNTGNATLNIASISITGANSGDFAQTSNCSETLTPTSQCTVNVTFTPSVIAAESASLQFSDDAADTPQQVALSGTGSNVPPSYSIIASPTSLSIVQGQSGTTTLTITPVGGMTGTLSFSCTGLPPKTTCVYSPSQVVLPGDDEPVTVTLTVNTTGPNGVISELQMPASPWISARLGTLVALPLGFAIFFIPGWVSLPSKRRRHIRLAILLSLGALIAIGLAACGGSSSKATPTGQYTVSAVASVSGANTQSAVVTITVTQ